MNERQHIYAIRDWDKTFEVWQSRRVHGPLSWVAMPTKQGRGYRRIMRLEDGPAIFGAWCAMVQVAATCHNRGQFADNDGIYTIGDIADKCGMGEKIIARAISVCMSREVNWIEQKFVNLVDCDLPTGYNCLPTVHNITEQNRTYLSLSGENSGNEELPSGWIGDLIRECMSVRPEFERIRPMDWAAVIAVHQGEDREKVQSSIRDFCLHHVNGSACPDRPLKVLAGYLRAGTKPERAVRQNNRTIPKSEFK